MADLLFFPQPPFFSVLSQLFCRNLITRNTFVFSIKVITDIVEAKVWTEERTVVSSNRRKENHLKITVNNQYIVYNHDIITH